LRSGQMGIPMPTFDENKIPLVSRDVLDALEQELEDAVTYATYIRLNHELWPARYERLAETIRAGDATGAMDAVLSLRCASQMIGAMQLAELALTAQLALRDGRLSAAEELLEDLEVCGTATMRQISREFSLGASNPVCDTDWSELAGKTVEIHSPNGLTDSGEVDAVTVDGRILWLKLDGLLPRRMVEKTAGVRVRVIK
jgi:hypothetical protein